MEITSDSNENEKLSSSVSLPLLSRIDRLEVAMRRLEMKQSSSSSGCSSIGANNNTFSPSSGLTSEHHHHHQQQQQKLPVSLDLDMALKEVTFKGSLLERIKTLENRLFQLRLRVESDKLEARGGRDRQPSSLCQFPVFTMSCQSSGGYKKDVEAPNADMIINNIESQGEEHDNDNEKPKIQNKKNKKKKSKSENGDREKTPRRKKKDITREAEVEKIKNPNWSHLRILGC